MNCIFFNNDGSLGIRFHSASPYTYASWTNSRSGTKYGGRSKAKASLEFMLIRMTTNLRKIIKYSAEELIAMG
jgi:hypothetical protein